MYHSLWGKDIFHIFKQVENFEQTAIFHDI